MRLCWLTRALCVLPGLGPGTAPDPGLGPGTVLYVTKLFQLLLQLQTTAAHKCFHESLEQEGMDMCGRNVLK
jgi:hypothetical protein